jgi:prepilin-type N-terminal cleavage/methylation domain-containing protein
MRGTASAQNGFTLVEAIIVLLILGIVTAIAIPGFRIMAENGSLKAAARDLLADFSTLKQRAISENIAYKITFNDQEDVNNYTIRQQGGAPIQIKTPAIFGAIRIFSASFGRGKTITFQTRGISFPAGHVVLINNRNSTATITVNFAGRTYVQFDLK